MFDIEYILGIVSATLGIIGLLYQLIKNRKVLRENLSFDELRKLSVLYNYILNIVVNFDTLSDEEKRNIGRRMIKKGIDGIGHLGYMENKQLNSFVKFINGTGNADFNIDEYKMTLKNALTKIQGLLL